MFSDLFEAINLSYFFLSALLFLTGVYVGPIAAEKEIGFLLRYPRWIFRIMQRYFNLNVSFWILFPLIFILNNISLFSSFLSGFLIIGPPAAAFITGFNVAVISYDMMGWRGIWQILVNPVAWLEFPAAWIALSLGFELAQLLLTEFNWQNTFALFNDLWPIYIKYVGILLLIAALLESGLIVIGRRFPDDS